MIRKAVIPAAGLGTRFLPVTKEQPKEMLPIVDKPTIQFVVEEAVASGIKDILVVSGKGKRAIEDHFDRSFELEYDLKSKGKDDLLAEVRRIWNMADVHFIRQKEMAGLGDAIRYASTHVSGEPFAVLLGDTIIESDPLCTKQLIEVHNKYQCAVIAVERVPPESTVRYGIMAGKEIGDSLYEVSDLVEKPPAGKAPSDLAIAGRYILTPDIFKFLQSTKPGVAGEIQITDAMRLLLKEQKLLAYRINGKRFDIGNRLEYVKTIVQFALRRPDIGEDVREFLRSVMAGEEGSG